MIHQNEGLGVVTEPLTSVYFSDDENDCSLNPSPKAKGKQRALILQHLKSGGSLSTIDIREKLGVLHPAGRIMELRRQGWNIVATVIHQYDAEGRPHRVAVYRLASEGKQ